MIFEIRTVDIGRGEHQLAGRAVGEKLYEQFIAPALAGATSGTLLLLSLRGVEFATGSVFKQTWHRLHPGEGVVVPSMLTQLSDDVRAEFSIYLRSERVAGLEALSWSANTVRSATLHGHLEESGMSALQAVVRNPASTAPQLQAASSEDVSPTAWTNRLNELHRQGLAYRQKAGRAWRFFPLASEVNRG